MMKLVENTERKFCHIFNKNFWAFFSPLQENNGLIQKCCYFKISRDPEGNVLEGIYKRHKLSLHSSSKIPKWILKKNSTDFNSSFLHCLTQVNRKLRRLLLFSFCDWGRFLWVSPADCWWMELNKKGKKTAANKSNLTLKQFS